MAGSREGWSLVVDAVRRQRLAVSLGVAFGLGWTAAKVSIGLLVGHAIDDGIEADDPAALRHWSILLGGVALAAGLFTGARRYMAFRVARRVEADLRDRLFAQVQRLHFGFHDTTPTGELMSRANSDLQQVQLFLLLIPLTISNVMTVLSVTLILVSINPLLTLLAVGSLPFMNVLATRFSRQMHPHVMGIQRESAELAAVVEESVAGVRVIKGLGAEPVQAARLRDEADDVFDQSMAAAETRAHFVPALELLPNLGFVAVLAYGGHLVLDGGLTLGALVAFNVYIGLLVWPLRMLGMIVAQAQRAAVSGQRVHEVLATEPAIVDPPDPVPLPLPSTAATPDPFTERDGDGAGGRRVGELRFDKVVFGYGEDNDMAAAAMPLPCAVTAGSPRVLDGFELTIAAGESVALVGATASGKSTVARLVPRFYDVDGGRILLDGVDVRDVRLPELRQAVGLVFEDTFLFSDTIAANVAFARPDAPHEVVERATRLAGVDDFVRSLADGYETRLGERGYSLSGGQRQRIAIARAIVADPRVLILDDATSAVDPTKEHEIRDALVEVMRGRTTIVIAHRPATIALADRVVLLDQGVVAADGTHAQLLAASPRYRQVLAAAHHEDGHDGDGHAHHIDGPEHAQVEVDDVG